MNLTSGRLKELREENKYTQAEVAEKLNMSLSGYRKLEYGEREPTAETIKKISILYSVTSDYLLGLNDFKNGLDGLRVDVVLAENNMNIAKFQYLIVKSAEGLESASTINAYGNYLQTKGHYNKLFYGYLIDFFNQPNPNPFEDIVLKDKFPIEYMVEPDSANEFGVIITAKCADGHDLGKIKNISGVIGMDIKWAREDAEKYIDYMMRYFKLK